MRTVLLAGLLSSVALAQPRAAATTCSPGGILWCSAAGEYSAATVGGSGDCLKSGVAGAPTWGDCGPAEASATFPTAPTASGETTYFNYAPDAGFPTIPMTIDNVFGIPIPTGQLGNFPYYGSNANWFSGCIRPATWGSGGMALTNMQALSATGTPGNINWAATNIRTRMKALSYSSATALNASAAVKEGATIQEVWRGDVAGAGGFLVWMRVVLATARADIRFAAGLFNTTSVLTASADPDAATNTVYFGCNVGDTELHICSNDGTSTATCNTLGTDFPCDTSAAMYDFWLAAPPNGSVINYFIERLDTPARAAGPVTSDLPLNNVQMNFQIWMNTGTVSTTAIRFDFMGVCVASNL